jgi:predicted phage terminase large subunit-like protein
MKRIEIKPQPGPQTAFLSSEADIAIYGGAAGGGKSFGLLLEPLRHYSNPDFGGVIFRRTTKQVRNEGGLWDEALALYGQLGFTPKESTLEFRAPSGMAMSFGHLEHEKDVLNWQGAQIPFIGFDELTHFSRTQFFYMLSRLRSATAGVRGYVRATTNPSSASWVRRFIDWWIDPKTGFAIPERSGVLRWFVRINDDIHWADSREELLSQFGADKLPMSVTFIPAKLEDNKILLEKDPSYRAKLEALSRVERMQLLDGNWNVEPAAGLYFKKIWFPVVDALPAGLRFIRHWDRAATEGGGDYTVGLKLGKASDGRYYIAHVERGQWSPAGVERALINTARHDGTAVTIGVEQDPGSAGVADISAVTKLLAGFDVKISKPSEDKVTRAKPVSAQVEAGNVYVLRAPWNDAFFTEAENFPEGANDDQIDGLSGAFNLM